MADVSIPLATCDYNLRRLNAQTTVPIQKLAFDLAFPGFAGLDEPTPNQRKRMGEAEKANIPVTWQNKPARRHAGDWTLPPGRYYTLPRKKWGDDGNTLLMELLAYYNPATAGPIRAVDTGTPEMTEWAFGETGVVRPAIWVDFLSYPNQPSPIFEAADKAGLLSIIKNLEQHPESDDGETFVPVVFAYELLPVSMTRVLDLRLPACQDWLVRVFGTSPLERYAMKDSEYSRTKHFHEMLPSLLTPEWGGGMFSGIANIGHCLRKHNVEALVYPSARTDVAVQVMNGVIEDHRGWNLVDYRDAPTPTIDVMLDLSFFNAPAALPETVQVILPPADDPSLRGSFIVKGLANWHLARLSRLGAIGVLELK